MNLVTEEVRAEYSFAGENEGEVSFNQNDIIFVTKKHEDGWWEGYTQSKSGVFPSNYTIPFSEQLQQCQATVLYDYDTNESEELPLRKDEVITVIRQHDGLGNGGWWTATKGKKNLAFFHQIM